MKKSIALLLIPLIYLSAANINTISAFGTARDIALSSDGTKAYVAFEDAGVAIFDVNLTRKKSKPYRLGRFDSEAKNAYAMGITLSRDGKTAYVANYRAGLLILDVNDSLRPKKLGSLKTYEAWDVTLSSDGKTAYVADDFEGLKIIDVNDSSNPTLLGTCKIDGSYLDGTGERAWNVGLSSDDSTVYMADGNKLVLFDVHVPAACNLKKVFEMEAGTLGITLSSDGKTAYVANYTKGLKIIDDVNNTTSTIYTVEDNLTMAYDVTLNADGTKAYVADYFEGLVIIDVSNHAETKTLRTIHTPGSPWSATLSPDGTKAYVADTEAGMTVIDLGGILDPFGQ